MHFYTHLKDASDGVTGLGIYADGMVEHDKHVGEMLDLLDELGISGNTIVVYTVDNGPHYNEWPDGGISPYRGEKNTNWEGGYRIPTLVRWPGTIASGRISNEVISMLDWVPTFMAAVGEPDIKDKLIAGHEADGKDFKVYLDGYNFLPYLSEKADKGPRIEFFYWNDGGELVGLRYAQWKLVFMEQRKKMFDVWSEPFVKLRLPKLFNLRSDPYERADTDSNNYRTWWIRRVFTLVPAQTFVGDYMATFKDFPPRQKPAKFNVDDVLAATASPGAH